MLKVRRLFENLPSSRVTNSRVLRIKNAKFSGYCFYVKTNKFTVNIKTYFILVKAFIYGFSEEKLFGIPLLIFFIKNLNFLEDSRILRANLGVFFSAISLLRKNISDFHIFPMTSFTRSHVR